MTQTLLRILTWKQKCERTRRQEHTQLQTSFPKPLSHSPVRTWRPRLTENNLRLWTRLDDTLCILAWFYFGRLLQPLTNENHMMDHIQKQPRISHRGKKKNINRKNSESKLSGDLIPAVHKKKAEAIGWFQLFAIISDGPLVQNKAQIIKDV